MCFPPFVAFLLQIEELVDKIATLQSTMNPTHHKPLPPIPTIRPEEVPERQQEYTKESLLKFKEEKGAREEAERLEAAGGGEGGFFGGFGGGGGDEEGDGDGEDIGKGEEGEETKSVEASKVQQEVWIVCSVLITPSTEWGGGEVIGYVRLYNNILCVGLS